MNNEFKVLPRWVIHLFLWIGLLAGISIRLLTFLNRIDPVLSVWVWRFAMVSYTVFFGYRYVITKRRRHIITRHELLQAIEANTELDPVKQQALVYILRSVVRSKELFNYMFICVISIIALAIDFFID